MAGPTIPRALFRPALVLAALVAILLLPIAGSALAQFPEKDVAAVMGVLEGYRTVESLTPEQRRLLVLMLQQRSVPEHCSGVDSAAKQLQSAAEDLVKCARKRDFSDDCSRKAREVRWAADEYEDAVSEHEGRCD